MGRREFLLKNGATIREALSQAEAVLKEAGVPDALWDAEELMEWAGGPDRTHLPLEWDTVLTKEKSARFEEGISRRRAREPLQQILGHVWFMGLRFTVNDHVLCPRQDTELLAERALEILKASGKPSPRILDLCCGSGCIGISLAVLFPGAEAVLSDISEEVLALAKKNAKHNGCAEHRRCARGDLCDAVFEEGSPLDEAFDLICCNPPYIPTKAIDTLMPEISVHEPLLALDGGEDGLIFYRRLAETIMKNKDAPPVLLEIGCEQGAAVKKIFTDAGASSVKILRDLAGLDRVAEISMRKE